MPTVEQKAHNVARLDRELLGRSATHSTSHLRLCAAPSHLSDPGTPARVFSNLISQRILRGIPSKGLGSPPFSAATRRQTIDGVLALKDAREVSGRCATRLLGRLPVSSGCTVTVRELRLEGPIPSNIGKSANPPAVFPVNGGLHNNTFF